MTQESDHIRILTGRVEEWLRNPPETDVSSLIEHAEALIRDLRDALDQNPEAGKILGPLIARVNSNRDRIRSMETVDWVPVDGGTLAIGHRPGSKLISAIALQGGTHILTLLSESEGARQVEKLTRKEGLEWIWFSMDSAAPPEESRRSELETLFHELSDILGGGGQIYLHCSAGIHRTGMITHAFLRYLGYSADEAGNTLESLRPHTRREVGEHRLSWGNRFAAP